MMIKKLGITVALAAVLLAVLAIPSFAAKPNTYDQQLLQIRYDAVDARVGFTTGVLTDVASLVPQASDLNSHISQLNGDLATLNTYVQNGDPSGFTSYVSGTIDPDLRSAHSALAADRLQFHAWNVSKDTRDQLKTDYQNRLAAFQSQMNSITLERGNLRLSWYNDAITSFDGRMTNLSAKGVDVSAMQSIRADAQASVIVPLQAAVTAGDVNATKDQLKGTALGNGAPYSYHFWAKMDLAGENALLGKIADNATQAGHGDQVATVSSQLSTVSSTLTTVGTSPYTIPQKNTIWDNLKSAAQGIRTIIKELGGV